MTIKWETPPPAPLGGPIGKGRLQRIATELQARPGEWAFVNDYSGAGSASNAVEKLKLLGCEATRRGPKVWARWPGDV